VSDRDSSSAIRADITLSMYDQVAESSKFPRVIPRPCTRRP
jgi:hypothetical protein